MSSDRRFYTIDTMPNFEVESVKWNAGMWMNLIKAGAIERGHDGEYELSQKGKAILEHLLGDSIPSSR